MNADHDSVGWVEQSETHAGYAGRAPGCAGRQSRAGAVLLQVLLLVASLWTAVAAIAGEEEAREHPLLKGVRSPEVWNREWPGTLHDKLLTGFSPLNCGMKQTPRVWATIHPGGRATHAVFLTDEQGEGFLVVQDGSLRRIGPEGNVVWQYPAGGILFYDQLHGDGAYTLGVQRGSTLVLLEPRTGEPFWQQAIEGTIGPDKVRVAGLHPDYPGKQIVVFPQYVTVAYMFAFPEGRRQPEQVWKTTDAAVANWPSRADHGVTTVIEPDGSVIWNVRHHTINTHDPVTGKLVRRFEFESGGGKRRNYGPTVIGPSPEGEPLLAVVGQFVQHHLTCFRRTQSEPPSLILDRYVGEVYGTHGVRMWLPVGGSGDADGDGGLDIVYSARVTQPKIQTQTVVCDVGTGTERTIPDTWIAGIADVTGNGKKEIFVYADPEAEMSRRGTLAVYRFDEAGELAPVDTLPLPNAELVLRPPAPTEQPPEAAWGNPRLEAPVVLHTDEGAGVLIRDHDARQARVLLVADDGISQRPAPEALFDARPLATGKWKKDGPWQTAVESPEGTLRVIFPDGRERFELPLTGGGVSLASAADLTGDGRCELVLSTPHGRLQVYTFDPEGRPNVAWSAPFIAHDQQGRLSVPMRDIDGDGRTDVLG
ncbi:MAG: VCBS repeat-containing protein, partial [Planctomycetota bacterium]